MYCSHYSVSDCGKKVWVVVDDAIKLVHRCIIRIKMTHIRFCGLVCGILALGKLLQSPKEAVADSLLKYLVSGWWSSPVQPLPRPCS